ncbi:hypothetical protein JWZ98_03235 [Methylomonas sp. EFPC1]|uniref:hypothetical protein n=1 Tax=Methylomonas sp. EFPC1 TaxID=2812647 RepID=UPI0019681760|nr:hypothetical protein [Methylomonas sp. EFPC1]QSB01989.1 hypothetical protein JWZ98_03235 [Methylomonas sp. EFPC1]
MSATLAGLRSQIMDRMEELENEITALRCVTGLLNGQVPGANAICLSELSYIIDPIIEREKAILDDVRGMFKTVGFEAKA